MYMSKKLVKNVITFPEFAKATKKLFSADELTDLARYITANPEKGDVIRGTNGARKLRWAAKGKGKRGGARIIYYYYVTEFEVYLISAYAKNQKSDLSSGDKNAIKQLIEALTKGGENG
jgi:mRNA-degrading endonuclease RelE of RelBE toxin-antitoxin system